jgi:HK97 family phage major capsid protein
MSTTLSVSKTRLQRLMDERVTINKLHEDLIASAESRGDDKALNDVEENQITGYRERMDAIDKETGELLEVVQREEKSASTSKIVRAHLAGDSASATIEDGQTVYRTYAAYARDSLLVKYPELQSRVNDRDAEYAKERLMRAPQHTLSSDLPGLIPPQYLTQILDVINKSRPVISTARSVNLVRGSLSYPNITGRPTVEVQGTQKTEGGTAKMVVAMDTVNARTYLGGGNLSWQAIEWSTPDALQLWFDLAAESYAKRTETFACATLGSAAALGGTAAGTALSGTSTFDQWIAKVVGGLKTVYTNSDTMADTLYLSPDMFFLAASLTSPNGAKLISSGGLNLKGMNGDIAGLNVVTSYGFGTARAIVGDSSAFIVAENSSAPVQLRSTEPAIGGMEVGLIGAIACVAFENSRFATLT